VLQSSILWVGWPIVGIVTVIQTVAMIFRLLRRQQGYKV
jgi:biofilm PGA synthesis N-glycosyltransferase PgaC